MKPYRQGRITRRAGEGGFYVDLGIRKETEQVSCLCAPVVAHTTSGAIFAGHGEDSKSSPARLPRAHTQWFKSGRQHQVLTWRIISRSTRSSNPR